MVSRCVKRGVVGLVGLLLLPSVTWAGDKEVLIERTFKPGAVGYAEVNVQIKQKIAGAMFGPDGMTMNIDQTFGVVEKVESASKDGAKVTLTFDRVRDVLQSSMTGDDAMSYDSDDPANEDSDAQIKAIVNLMLGEKMTISVGRGGKVKSFSGMDALAEKIKKKAMGNGAWMFMQHDFNDQQARTRWAEEPLALYPNRKVKVGDTWTSTVKTEIPNLGVMVKDFTCKLERVAKEDGREMAFVSIAVKLHGDNSGKGAPQAKINGSGKGEAVYDVELGQFVKQQGEGTVLIEATMPGTAGGGDDEDDDDASDTKDNKGDKGKAKAKDDDDDDKGGDPEKEAGATMKIDVKIKSSMTWSPESERAKQRAAAKAKADAAKTAEKSKEKEESDD